VLVCSAAAAAAAAGKKIMRAEFICYLLWLLAFSYALLLLPQVIDTTNASFCDAVLY